MMPASAAIFRHAVSLMRAAFPSWREAERELVGAYGAPPGSRRSLPHARAAASMRRRPRRARKMAVFRG